MANPFQTPFNNPALLDGMITSDVLQDPDLPPSTIIKSGAPFTVKVSWNLTGSVVAFMGGFWKVKVNVESLGSGPEGGSAPATVPVVAGQNNYTATTNAISLPAGTYKLITVITYENPNGTPRELAGFDEGPIIQVYDAV